jgi:hypothetical protein
VCVLCWCWCCDAAGLAVSLLVFARKKGVNMSALGIGIDFLQIVSIFRCAWKLSAAPATFPSMCAPCLPTARTCAVVFPVCCVGAWVSSFGFKWPPQLTVLFSAASSSSFNQQLLAPECSVGNVGFQAKWFLLQSTPLVFIAGLVLVTVVDALWVRVAMEQAAGPEHGRDTPTWGRVLACGERCPLRAPACLCGWVVMPACCKCRASLSYLSFPCLPDPSSRPRHVAGVLCVLHHNPPPAQRSCSRISRGSGRAAVPVHGMSTPASSPARCVRGPAALDLSTGPGEPLGACMCCAGHCICLCVAGPPALWSVLTHLRVCHSVYRYCPQAPPPPDHPVDAKGRVGVVWGRGLRTRRASVSPAGPRQCLDFWLPPPEQCVCGVDTKRNRPSPCAC